MSFLCFPASRTRSVVNSRDGPETTVLHSDEDFERFVKSSAVCGTTAILCWTAPFSTLHYETLIAFQDLAAAHPRLATYAVCSVDTLPDKARESAVCSLPTFHVFQHGSLVTKFEGLSSLQILNHALRSQSSPAEASRDKGLSFTGSLQNPGNTQASARTSLECAACDQQEIRRHIRNKSSLSEADSTTSSQTDDVQHSSNFSSTSQPLESPAGSLSTMSSYWPTYVKTKRIPASRMNWHPSTDFGTYQFQ